MYKKFNVSSKCVSDFKLAGEDAERERERERTLSTMHTVHVTPLHFISLPNM